MLDHAFKLILNLCRLLLEEQTSRNTLLEKKQRKFDAEIGTLTEARRQEEAAREKVVRECDQLKANKFQLEDQVQVRVQQLQPVFCQSIKYLVVHSKDQS